MKRRLTQPMRRVLSNLINGDPVDHGLTRIDPTTSAAGTILTALRKRGLVEQQSNATFSVTPQGQAALLEAHTKGMQ